MSTDLTVLETQLAPLAPRFEQALAGMLPVDRLIQSVLISVERTPALLDCSRDSILRSAMSAACLGLPIDGVTGQSFMIPFKERGTPKAQLVIGYKGFNSLGARADLTITGKVVREGEPFDYELGSAGFVRHKPLGDISKRITHAWAVARHRFRPPIVEVMSIDELMAVKDKSPGARRSDSPWNEPRIGFPAMCEKTPKRRLARSFPMAPGPLAAYHTAARMDEAYEEQGLPSHVTERGLEIEGHAEPIGGFEQSPTPSAEHLTSPRAEPGGDGGRGGSASSAPPAEMMPRDEYLQLCHDTIDGDWKDEAALRDWWSKGAAERRRYRVTQSEVDAMKQKIAARIGTMNQSTLV